MSNQSKRRKAKQREAKVIAKAHLAQIHNQKNNSPTDSNSGQRAANNSHVEGENRGVVFLVRDAIGATGGAVLAGAAFSLQHPIFGLLFTLIAVVAVLHIPVHYLAKSNPKSKSLIWTIFSVVVGSLLVLDVVWSFKIQTQKPKSQIPVIVVPQPDYIPGTQYTPANLEHTFPFGYAVIYYLANQRLTYDVVKNGRMDWKTDWDSVQIKPNFAAGNVEILTGPFSVTTTGNGPWVDTAENGLSIDITIPFKKGYCTQAGVYIINKPVPYVAVLSDDQRNPVFAIGFRIPGPGE